MTRHKGTALKNVATTPLEISFFEEEPSSYRGKIFLYDTQILPGQRETNFSLGFFWVLAGSEPDFVTQCVRPPLWTSSYRTTYSPNDMYNWLQRALRARKAGLDGSHRARRVDLLVNDKVYAFQRGGLLVVVSNGGSNMKSTEIKLRGVPFNAGTRICNPLSSDDCITVGESATMTVRLVAGEPKMYCAEPKCEFETGRELT